MINQVNLNLIIKWRQKQAQTKVKRTPFGVSLNHYWEMNVISIAVGDNRIKKCEDVKLINLSAKCYRSYKFMSVISIPKVILVNLSYSAYLPIRRKVLDNSLWPNTIISSKKKCTDDDSIIYQCHYVSVLSSFSFVINVIHSEFIEELQLRSRPSLHRKRSKEYCNKHSTMIHMKLCLTECEYW